MEQKIDIALHHAMQCRDVYLIKKFPCPLIIFWHNDPLFTPPAVGKWMINALRLNFFPIKNISTSAAANAICKLLLKIYHQLCYLGKCRVCDRFVLLSKGFVSPLWATKFYPQKITAIGNPATFPLQAIDFSAKKRELLFVGRMENGQKRVDLLLRIWAKLEARFPEWSLRLVGGGADLEANKNLAGTLGLQRAFFEGFQKPEKFYRDASIFCMTSAYEGFGMVLVEASAFGCVPVAFDSFAAVHDIISDGENGALVPAFDSEKYAETLARLMSDAPARERLAKNALGIAEKFSPEKIAAQWEKLFGEIVPAGTRK